MPKANDLTIDRLLESASIVDVIFTKVHIERHDEVDENRDSPMVLGVGVTDPQEEGRLGVRVGARADWPNAEVEVQVEVQYALEGLTRQIPEPLVRAFVTREAVPTAIPFLREALHMLSQRAKAAIPMIGVVKDVKLTTNEEDSEERSD